MFLSRRENNYTYVKKKSSGNWQIVIKKNHLDSIFFILLSEYSIELIRSLILKWPEHDYKILKVITLPNMPSVQK